VTFSSFAAISPACWFADVARTTIYLWFGSLLMFGSFTKSTHRHGGSHRVVALEGALKTIINDFPHEHCSIAKNLLHLCGKRDGALSFAAEERRRKTLVVGWKMIRPCHCGLQKGHKRYCLWSLSFFFRVPWLSPV
jgi:hypothetical protein